eukprot:TRINITY_DN11513_c0_g1_i3.p1 TRINITY_DN11513_c0_g1~~TRINITY_DN11513_c0_g1_i3.p1  ORF type:complete len:172 (-),score=35.90 TRINITY_DN11513_c0_g1_i3:130-645(-)
MHRDVRPENVLFDVEKKELKVIDWGSAKFYFPHGKYGVKCFSKYYAAPDVLLGNCYYDYSVDVWSLGCTFAELLFQIPIFFKGDGNGQLQCIAKVLGTEAIYSYADKFGFKFARDLETSNKQPWKAFKNEENEVNVTEDAIDLLSQMLTIDHTIRITAKDALTHPYFKELT